jgi:hypothetical protein
MPLEDLTDGFALSDELLKRYQNEVRALRILWSGLEYLDGQVRLGEQAIRGDEPQPSKHFFWEATGTGVDLPMGLITCSFHWYAVSACNFVRLIGWVRRDTDSTAPRPLEYVDAVLPEVKPFRDKVAAHFARMSQDSRDTDAEKLASMIGPPAIVNGVFVINAMQVHVWRGGQGSDSSTLPAWSLTEVHGRLADRYGMRHP